MTKIFISYRRDDSAMATGRLFDHLSARFGENQVFMDITTIEPGDDFVEVIETHVAACDVLIAAIGGQWLSITDAEGNRRLDNENDFVRLEIASALKRNIRIIPVLLDGAQMPQAEKLPEELKLLTRRSALKINAESFRYDVSQLIKAIEKALALVARSVIAGQWIDRDQILFAFFKQFGDRVMGFYSQDGLQKLGLYYGEIEGDVCNLKWVWLDNSLQGKATATVLNNTNTLSVDYWVEDEVYTRINMVFLFMSEKMPTWLTEEDFAEYDYLLRDKK